MECAGFFFELRLDMDIDDSYALFNLYNASDGEGDTPIEKPPIAQNHRAKPRARPTSIYVLLLNVCGPLQTDLFLLLPLRLLQRAQAAK